MSKTDIRFYFDPVCPFAWMTSKWVRMVAEQRNYTVEWRFISLRLINSEVDYDARFPEGYDAGHTAGLKLLRVAAKVREDHGPEAVGALYKALGERIFEVPQDTSLDTPELDHRGTPAFVEPALVAAGLDPAYAAELDNSGWDEAIANEGEEARALTGHDVGTPIIHFEPPTGVAFFGPVISRLPKPAEAGELWDHVVALARFHGFAELKRSLRERPQLASFGVSEDEVGIEEDWQRGSRRKQS